MPAGSRFGAGPVSLVLTGLIICVVAYLALTKIDRPAARTVANHQGQWSIDSR